MDVSGCWDYIDMIINCGGLQKDMLQMQVWGLIMGGTTLGHIHVGHWGANNLEAQGWKL